MVELRTKITKSGILHVPEELKEVLFGRDMKIIASTTAALLLPTGISYEDALRSLEIIRADIQFRILPKEKQEAKAKQEAEAKSSSCAGKG